MHGGDRYNGTRGSRGDQWDNRLHRNNQEIRQRNTRPQNHNSRPQHSVPVSTQYPVDYKHFLNIYPSSAHSFMFPNMSVPPPPHPPPSNMWCPQWSQTESRDYRSFSIFSGQQQLCSAGHTSAMQEEVSRRKGSIPENLFNMPPPPVSSRVPMPMSELYPPSPDMQSSISETQASSPQTQVSSSRTQTSSRFQSSTSEMQTSTSGLHASTSELHAPTSAMHGSTLSLNPSTSGAQSFRSRRGPSLVPESHRTTSEYVSHTLIHHVTSGVPQSESGLQSQSHAVILESQQSKFQSPTSGAQTPSTRRNSVSPEMKSFSSQSATSGSEVTPYRTQQSTSATQSKSFYSENIFEPQLRHISDRRPSGPKTHPLGTHSRSSCSENICESRPSTSGYISDRRSSVSETQLQTELTETDISTGFSWLQGSLYVCPPRVIRNDINEPEEVPISKFFEFVNCVKKTVFPHLFFNNSDESQFIDALNMFLKLLSDVRTSIRVPDYLLNFLMRIVYVASRYYRRITCSHENEYLEIMEDVFIHYSEVVLALFEIWDLTEETEKPGSFIGKITRMLLTRSMLRRIDNVLNCLIKIETHPSLHFHCRFLIDLYWVFLRYLNFKYTDENLIRMFVIWKKFELLWPDDVVKLRECRENQLRHGRRHVVLESIPVLNEMIEVSKKDPRYSVRDVIAIYWWWWEITKDELRNKSEKERVNIIRFPKMCNSRYLAHKPSEKAPQFASNLIAVKRERDEMLLTKMAKHIKRPARIDSTFLWDFRTPIISCLQENNASIIADCLWVFEPSIEDTIEIDYSYSLDNEQAISDPLETHRSIGRSRNEAERPVELQKAPKSINTSHIQDIKILNTIGESRTSVETTMFKLQKVVDRYADLSNVQRVSKHAPDGHTKHFNTPPDQNLNILSLADDNVVTITECQESIKRQYNSVRQVGKSSFEKASRSIGIQLDQGVFKCAPVAEIRSDVVKAGKKREEEFIEVSNDSVQLQLDKSDSIRKSSSSQPEIQKKIDTFQYNRNDKGGDTIFNGPMQVSKDVGDHHAHEFLLESTAESIGSPSEKSLEVFLPRRSSCIGDSRNGPIQTTSVVCLESGQGSIYSKEDDVLVLANISEDEKLRLSTDELERISPVFYVHDKRRTAYVSEEGEHQIDRGSLENREAISSDTLKKAKPSILSDDLHDMTVTLELVRSDKKLEIQSSDDVSEGKGLNANKQEKTKFPDKQSGENVAAHGTSKNSQVEKLTLETFERRHKEQRTCGVELHGETMEAAKGFSEEIFEKTNPIDGLEEMEQVHVVKKTSLSAFEKSKKHGNKPEEDKDWVSVENQEKLRPELHKSSQDSHGRKSEQMFQELNSVDGFEKEEHKDIGEDFTSVLEKTRNIHGVETEEVSGILFEKKEEKSISELHNVPKGLTVLEKARSSYDGKSEQDDLIKTREISEKLYSIFEDNCKKTTGVSDKLSSKDVLEERDHTKEKMSFSYEKHQGIRCEDSQENVPFLDEFGKRYDGKLEERLLHEVPEKIKSCHSEQSEKISENRFSGVTEGQADTKLKAAKLSYKKLEVCRSMPASSEGQLINIPVLENTEETSEEISKDGRLCVQADIYKVKNEEQAHKKSSHTKSEKTDEVLSLHKSMEIDFAKLHVTTKKLAETQFDNTELSTERSSTEMLEEKHSQIKKVALRILETFRDMSVIPDTSSRQQVEDPKPVFRKRRLADVSEEEDHHIGGSTLVQNKKSEYPLEVGASSTQHPNHEDLFENNSADVSPLSTEEILDVSQESSQERHCDKADTSLLATAICKSKSIGLDGTDKCMAIFKNLEKSRSVGETNRLQEEKVFFKVMKVYNETGRIGSLEDEDKPEGDQNRHKEIQDIGHLGVMISNTSQADRKKILDRDMLIAVKVQPNAEKILKREDLYSENLTPGEHENLGQEGQQTLHNVTGDDVMDENDGAFYLSDFDRVFLSLDVVTPETNRQQFRDSLDFCMNKTLQLPEKCSSSMKISSFNNRPTYTKQLYQQVDSNIDLCTENKIVIVVKEKDAASRQKEEALPKSEGSLIIGNENLNQESAVLSHSRSNLDSLDNVDEGSCKENNSVTTDMFVSDTTEEFDKLEKIQQSSVLEGSQIKLGKLKKDVYENIRNGPPTVETIEKIVFEESAMESSGLEQIQVSCLPEECTASFMGKRANTYDGVVRIGGDEAECSECTAKFSVSERLTEVEHSNKPQHLDQCLGCNFQIENNASLSDEIENESEDNKFKIERSSVASIKCPSDNSMSFEKKKDKKLAATKWSAVCSKPEIVQNSNSAVEKPGILLKGNVKVQFKLDKPAGVADNSMNCQSFPMSEKAPVLLDATDISIQTERAICKGFITKSKEDRTRLIEAAKSHSDLDVASEGSGSSKQRLADIPKEDRDNRPGSEMAVVPKMSDTFEKNILFMPGECQGRKIQKNVVKRKHRKSGYCEETGPLSPQQYQEHVKKIRGNQTHIGESSVTSDTPFEVSRSTLETTTSSSELESGMNINEIVETPEPAKQNSNKDNILQNPQETFSSFKTLLSEEPGMDTMQCRQTDSNDDQQLKIDSLAVRTNTTLQQTSSICTADVEYTDKEMPSGQELKPLLNDNNISLISIDALDKCVEKKGSRSENLESTVNRIPSSVFSLNAESHLDKVLIKNNIHSFVSEVESWRPKTSGEGSLPSEVLSELFEESQDCLEDPGVTKPENSSYETLVRNEVWQLVQETQNQLSMSSLVCSGTDIMTVPDCDTPKFYGGTTSASTPASSRIPSSNPEKQLNIRDPRLAGKSEVARLYKCSQEVISDVGQKYNESVDSNAICGSKLTDSESQILPPTIDMDPSVLNPISQPNTLASFYSTFVKEVSETDIVSPPVPDDAPLEANVIIPISESQSGTLMSFDSQRANVTTSENKIMTERNETRTERQPLSDSQSYSIQSPSTQRRLDNVLNAQGVDSDFIQHIFTHNKITHHVEPTIEADVQLHGVAKQTSSILKKHVDKIPKVDNDLHAWSSESTVIGAKKHSVTFFEEKAQEIYNREYGNQTETKNNQNSRIRTRKRMSKVLYSKDDSEGVRPKRKKRHIEIFKKPETIDKPSRPHITAEDNELFQNAIEGPVGKPMRSTGDRAPMVLWDDKDELSQTGTISVKSDSQLHKVKNGSLVSVFKKPKNKDEHAEGRKYKGYKLPPSVDPKVLKEIVIRLTDNGIIPNSLIQRYSNKRFRQDKVGAGEREKRQLEVQAEHEKVLERARMMELKEQQLKQETGILYCIFSDKWSWTEKNNSSTNSSSKPATRKDERVSEEYTVSKQLDLKEYSLTNLNLSEKSNIAQNETLMPSKVVNENNFFSSHISKVDKMFSDADIVKHQDSLKFSLSEDFENKNSIQKNRISCQEFENENIVKAGGFLEEQTLEEDYSEAIPYLKLSKAFFGESLNTESPACISEDISKGIPLIGHIYSEDSRSQVSKANLDILIGENVMVLDKDTTSETQNLDNVYVGIDNENLPMNIYTPSEPVLYYDQETMQLHECHNIFDENKSKDIHEPNNVFMGPVNDLTSTNLYTLPRPILYYGQETMRLPSVSTLRDPRKNYSYIASPGSNKYNPERSWAHLQGAGYSVHAPVVSVSHAVTRSGILPKESCHYSALPPTAIENSGLLYRKGHANLAQTLTSSSSKTSKDYNQTNLEANLGTTNTMSYHDNSIGESGIKVHLPPKKRKLTEDEELAIYIQRFKEEKERQKKLEDISYPAQRQMSIADVQKDFPRIRTLAARKLYPEGISAYSEQNVCDYPPGYEQYSSYGDQRSVMNVYINGVKECSGESDDSHNHKNHRKGQKLPEKRKRNDQPEGPGPKKMRISIRTDLIEKCSKNPAPEEKDVSDNGITELQGRSRRSEKPLVGKQIIGVKNGPPKLQTRSGRLRKKPSGKDYYDLTESTGNRRKSST